jgi:hypothetical protein
MSDIDPEGRLRLIQESFNNVGNVVSDTIRATQPAPEVVANVDLVRRMEQLLKPLADRMDLLDAKLNAVQTAPIQDVPSGIPQRRNIAPTPQMQQQAQTGVTPSVSKSETPHLRAIIERTT